LLLALDVLRQLLYQHGVVGHVLGRGQVAKLKWIFLNLYLTLRILLFEILYFV
jgi:hypothetical protein